MVNVLYRKFTVWSMRNSQSSSYASYLRNKGPCTYDHNCCSFNNIRLDSRKIMVNVSVNLKRIWVVKCGRNAMIFEHCTEVTYIYTVQWYRYSDNWVIYSTHWPWTCFSKFEWPTHLLFPRRIWYSASATHRKPTTHSSRNDAALVKYQVS